MIYSGTKFCALRDKKNNYFNSLLSEKKILNETKYHTPPFKLNGLSLIIHLKLNIKLLTIDDFNYLALFAKLHTYGSSNYTRTCHNEQTCTQMNK